MFPLTNLIEAAYARVLVVREGLLMKNIPRNSAVRRFELMMKLVSFIFLFSIGGHL